MINYYELTNNDLLKLTTLIKQQAYQLGFNQIGISDINLIEAELQLNQWIEQDFQGEMNFMTKHGTKRSHPEELVKDTQRVICVAMNYLPESINHIQQQLNQSNSAFISRYALGRDYHKVLRQRLQQLANFIQQQIGDFGYRVFVDSAPVLEKPLAIKAGLGWIGKHTNIIHRQYSSWFFLGEIYTDLPLPIDQQTKAYCGNCSQCLQICPTQAIVAPYQIDARRCISYLTIELHGSIPLELRHLIGNRIYGCDDCQLICPWNKFAQLSVEKDFLPRHGLDKLSLIQAFSWTETEFLTKTEGSAIRRLGYNRWLRNIAVALGNAPYSIEIQQHLQQKLSHDSQLVREHIQWALEQQFNKQPLSI
ncbi:MAG: tRNA epoxyqueuosine(34) reductase QueG [Pseudomonadota bacterium]|jgi:epoxyqueuosine reductase